jgi:hypothetical protein
MELMLPAADIGSPKAFNFSVVAASPDAHNGALFDFAPDDRPMYSYTMTQAPTVRSTAAITSGSGKAGTTYVVRGLRVAFSDDTTVTTSELTCSATLAGARFKGTGEGGCTFKLPRAAKGKRFLVHVAGAYHDDEASVTSTQSFTVR